MRDVRPRSVRRRPPDEPEEADSGERHQHRGGSDAVLSICSTNRSNCRCPQPCWFEGLVDVGSPATSNPVVVPRSARRPGEQTGLHVGTARVVAEDRRSARGIGRFSPDPPWWADPEANRAAPGVASIGPSGIEGAQATGSDDMASSLARRAIGAPPGPLPRRDLSAQSKIGARPHPPVWGGDVALWGVRVIQDPALLRVGAWTAVVRRQRRCPPHRLSSSPSGRPS